MKNLSNGGRSKLAHVHPHTSTSSVRKTEMQDGSEILIVGHVYIFMYAFIVVIIWLGEDVILYTANSTYVLRHCWLKLKARRIGFLYPVRTIKIYVFGTRRRPMVRIFPLRLPP